MQIFRPAVLVAVLCSALAPQARSQVSPQVRDSIVKVTSTIREPDWTAPWRRLDAYEAVGTGMVVQGGRVLTCAHLVQHASRIHVQRDRSAKQLLARVASLSEALDVALLEPVDEALEAPGLPIRSELPKLQETVQLLGYPIAGSELATTEGVISRIQYTGGGGSPYRLMIQVDAAMNPGNSGGPAILDGAIAGMAIGVGAGNAVGFLLAGEELAAFLAAGESEVYEGRPQLFDLLQTFQNPDLKLALLPPRPPEAPEPTGMVVTRPYPEDERNPLRPLDLITHVEGHAVQDDGMVAVREDLRLELQYMIPRGPAGSQVCLTILRDRKEYSVHAPTRTRTEKLLRPLGNGYPSYFILGPMAFMPAYSDIFGAFGVEGILACLGEESPIVLRAHERPAFPGEELVLALPTLFDHPMTTGYVRPDYWVVHSVNGTRIRNLRHLVELLRDSEEDFLRFTFHGQGQETIVLDRTELLRSTEDVLVSNGIRSQASEELLELWQVEPEGPAPASTPGADEGPSTGR